MAYKELEFTEAIVRCVQNGEWFTYDAGEWNKRMRVMAFIDGQLMFFDRRDPPREDSRTKRLIPQGVLGADPNIGDLQATWRKTKPIALRRLTDAPSSSGGLPLKSERP